MKVKVKDVKANPYRNIDHYPLNKNKIMALTSSIEKTGFWDNLVGRKMNGEIQIAYGHHRIEALRLAKGYGYDFEFDLPIRDIKDGAMIQIMANENMQEWGHSIIVTDETVKVAKDFLENNINFFSGKKASKWKNTKAENGEVSAKDISEFLGRKIWTASKVASSLKRIGLIESGKVDKNAIESLPTETHAEEFAKVISKTDFTPKEQKEIAKTINIGKYGKRDVKGVVENAVFEKKYPKGKQTKTDQIVIDFAHKLLFITSDMTHLSDNFKKLKSMHNEIKNIQGEKVVWKVQVFFAEIGKLQRRINEFLEVMSKDNELTEENINTLKQLKQ